MKYFYKLRKKTFSSYQKEEGITLIALVITIIVLLILAGVTLTFIAGENGILKRATTAVDEQNEVAIAEEIELAMAALQIQYYEEYYVDKSISQTQIEYITQKLEEGIETNNGTIKLEEEKVSYQGLDGTVAEGIFDTNTGSILIEGITIKGETQKENIEIQLAESNIILNTFNTNTYTLIPTITPSNKNYELEWTSSDVSVATVTQDGTVTAKGVGLATIKAMIKGRKDIQVFCDVEVKEKIFEFTEGSFCSGNTYTSDSKVKDLAYNALTDGDYTKHGAYGGFVTGPVIGGYAVMELYANAYIEFSSTSYSDGSGSSGKTVVFYKENHGNYNEEFYTLTQINNSQKYGKYYFPAGKYKLQAMGDYVEFDQWDFEIVN